MWGVGVLIALLKACPRSYYFFVLKIACMLSFFGGLNSSLFIYV